MVQGRRLRTLAAAVVVAVTAAGPACSGDGSGPPADRAVPRPDRSASDAAALDRASAPDAGRDRSSALEAWRLVDQAVAPPRKWSLAGSQQVTRFVSAELFNGRVYAGTHYGDSSEIYDYPPLAKQQFFGGESVLDFEAFGGSLYSAHENGSKLYRLSGGHWDLVHDHPGWSYMFFLRQFQGALYAIGGNAQGISVLRTTNGQDYTKTADLAGWLWLPVEYQGELYLLGHEGQAYDALPAAGGKSPSGSSFTLVAALGGGPEYQCAHAWNGFLYLGTGGWTNDRQSNDSARIYRFDGTIRTQVHAVAMNGVTSIASSATRLYATVDSGWERAAGQSRIYESSDGLTWSLMNTFPEPEMRQVVVRPDGSLLTFGGRAGVSGVVYAFE